ncbi:insulin-like growth factor-binding protein complex acid labile subunit [Cloeon dipterum]|uniref:insulin-like growth factor-binding protein complex acid labile subunit n=1 Tax=Cloeon dipterum TaxID=197152 RepID=UPI00322009AB
MLIQLILLVPTLFVPTPVSCDTPQTTIGPVIRDTCHNSSYYYRHECICFSDSQIHCPGEFTAFLTVDAAQTVPSHMLIQCESTSPLPEALVPSSSTKTVVLTDCTFGEHPLLSKPALHVTDFSIYCRPGFEYRLYSSNFENLKNLKFLHIWCPSLVSVSGNAFKHVSNALTQLTIRGSQHLQTLEAKSFENLKHLSTLKIKDNQNLSKLPDSVFAGLKELKTLSLDRNALSKLPLNIFDGLEKLTDLSIVGNSLLVLEPAVQPGSIPVPIYSESGQQVTDYQVDKDSILKPLVSLKELNLDSNVLPRLDVLNQLRNLTRLSCQNCSLNAAGHNAIANLSHIEYLDLSNNSITNLPGGFLRASSSRLLSLTLTNNDVPRLIVSEQTFEGLMVLRHLNLSAASLHNIPLKSFKDLKKLKVVDLSRNKIQDLPGDLFEENENLEKVSFASNSISVLPNDLFANLTQMRELDLSDNLLSRIPSFLFEDSLSITKLSFSGNNIRSLGTYDLLGLYSIEHLDISNNFVSTVDPDTMFNIASSKRNYMESSIKAKSRKQTTLRHLSMAKNKLKHLNHNIFSTLNKLEILDLSENFLTSVPNLHHLMNLRVLSLAGNQILELQSPLFSDGSNLRSVSFSNNKIHQFSPSLFTGLDSSLLHVDFSHNALAEFNTPALAGLKSITHLDLSYNQLTSVDFSAIPTINWIDLSNNNLTFKESGWVFYRPFGSTQRLSKHSGQWGRMATFSNCTELQYLALSNNMLSQILLDIRRLENLRHLDLTHNNITQIESQDLQYMSNNITVDLRYNKISSLQLRQEDFESDGKTYADLKSNVRILLDHNPVSCDCNLPNFLRYLHGDARLVSHDKMQTAQLVGENLACYLPVSMRGKKLSEIETWSHYLLPILGLCSTFQ